MSDLTIDRNIPPIRRPPFGGITKKTLEGSEPDWKQAAKVTPPQDAPNALVVLIDDAGFGNPRMRSAGRPLRSTRPARRSSRTGSRKQEPGWREPLNRPKEKSDDEYAR
jgi:hypothetical protein